jgi:hypothetical protein
VEVVVTFTESVIVVSNEKGLWGDVEIFQAVAGEEEVTFGVVVVAAPASLPFEKSHRFATIRLIVLAFAKELQIPFETLNEAVQEA